MLTNAPNIPTPKREPEPPTSSITRALCAELIRREQVGTLKYGKALEPHDGRRTLQDVLEELLDACVYVKKCIMEQEWQPIETLPKVGPDSPLLRVLVCGGNVGAPDTAFVCMDGSVVVERWMDRTICTDPPDAPTHWRPLPPPPKE